MRNRENNPAIIASRSALRKANSLRRALDGLAQSNAALAIALAGDTAKDVDEVTAVAMSQARRADKGALRGVKELAETDPDAAYRALQAGWGAKLKARALLAKVADAKQWADNKAKSVDAATASLKRDLQTASA
jgi:hypothetical protein